MRTSRKYVSFWKEHKFINKNNYKNNSANTEEFKKEKKKEKGNIFLNQITQRMNTVNILQTLFQLQISYMHLKG